MYFKRKIDDELYVWLNTKGHSPALVSGVRQCGKTRSIKQFASKYFKNVIYINFWETPSMKDAFKDSLKVDDIISSLSFKDPTFRFVENQTILIFDEIQDCPNARLSLKSFKEDNRFEVIASGSYIGLNIENKIQESVPKPNGAEDIIFMKTMDFEEFLWAFGYDSNQLNLLYNCLKNKIPIPNSIHSKMKELYKTYMCIGGYPEVLSLFLNNNKNYNLAFKKLTSLIYDIKGDPAKRKNEKGEPLYTPFEISRIQNAFELIATSLNNDNKRYVVSKIIGGNGIQKRDAIDYLLNANVAFKTYNVSNLSLPLKQGAILNDFKLFYSDIGILIASYGFDTIEAIMNDTIGMNKGYIYEAIVADNLYKANMPLYYFRKNSGLEIDFVISFKGYSTLIEVKTKSGNVKSSKTIMSHPDHYGKVKLIKFGDYNIGYSGEYITLPYYLIFALFKNEY